MSDDNLISLDDVAKAAEEALNSDDVQGFANDPRAQHGAIGMRFLQSLTSIKGGPLAPGCCTQGCCDDGMIAQFKA